MALVEKYRTIIEEHAAGAAAIAIPGSFVPVIDVAGVAGIWTNMLVKIAKKSGQDISHQFIGKFATSVASGVSGYILGSKIFGMLLHLIPGVGTLVYIGINGFLNYMFTYRLGKMTSGLMERKDFDLSDLSNLVTQVVAPLVAIPSVSEAMEIIKSAKGIS